jgi:hypothetical protein
MKMTNGQGEPSGGRDGEYCSDNDNLSASSDDSEEAERLLRNDLGACDSAPQARVTRPSMASEQGAGAAHSSLPGPEPLTRQPLALSKPELSEVATNLALRAAEAGEGDREADTRRDEREGTHSQKCLYIVPFCSKCTSALTFEIFAQARA